MNVSLAQQKLDLDEADRYLQSLAHEIESKRRVLQRAIRAIDSDKEDMLESGSVLAQEVRNIMRSITATAPNNFYNS